MPGASTNPVQFHWLGKESLVLGICITVWQPLKKCVALGWFVALKSVMVSGDALSTAPCVWKVPFPPAVLPRNRQCGEARAGEEGLKSAERMERATKKSFLLMSSHRCFYKEIKQKQVPFSLPPLFLFPRCAHSNTYLSPAVWSYISYAHNQKKTHIKHLKST